MRPRSRLLAKRGLPTIREGSEELVHDRNQTNSQHSSSSSSAQDYFHSICQLARPTFPLHEPDRDILSIGRLDSPKPCLRPQRLRQLAQPIPCPSDAAPTTEVDVPRPSSSKPEQAHSSEQERPTSADPLEYLYGYREAEASSSSAGKGSVPPLRRTHSVPCPGLSKTSCPDLHLPNSVLSPAVPQRSPLSRKKVDCAKMDGAPCGWRAKSSRNMDKQTIVSHWLSECRSAWREARIRACMLPAIAEK